MTTDPADALRLRIEEPPAAPEDRRLLAAALARFPFAVVPVTASADGVLPAAATRELLRVGRLFPGGAHDRAATRDEHDRPAPIPPGSDQAPFPFDEAALEAARAVWQAARGSEPLPAAPWHACITFDIDSAGHFASLRSAARTVRAVAPRAPLALANAAVRTCLGTAPDPALRLRFLAEALAGMDVPATFFVQTHRRHRLDSYQLARERPLRRALEAILRQGDHHVGLHSSYATREGGARFWRAQWEALRGAFGPRVEAVHRSHYLRHPDAFPSPDFDAPLVDSSVGYGSVTRSRAGTARPYRLPCGTIELPFTVMDSTWIYHERHTPAQALQSAIAAMEAVRRVGGVFVAVWHPHHSDGLVHAGWEDVLFDLVEEVRRRGGRFAPLAHLARRLQRAADRIEDLLPHGPPR